MYTIEGHHHISMITKDIHKNNFFYQKILGLRRVKVSVNQDDPTMYHLFFGDKIGSPGTGLTFFEMPRAGRTYEGTNAYTRIGLVVSSVDRLTYWKDRFAHFQISHEKLTTYANRPALPFKDPDGLPLMLIASEDQPSSYIRWEDSPIPKEHQIRGMGPVEISVRRSDKMKRTLTEIFHYHIISETTKEIIFQTDANNIFSEIVVKPLEGPREKPGRGSIHHLAIRAKSEKELKYWDQQVRKRGFHSSGVIDRYYFKSVYFRESNGIIFEIATDGPGFTVNEDIETLGDRLDLPPFLEERRTEIENQLTPIEEI